MNPFNSYSHLSRTRRILLAAGAGAVVLGAFGFALHASYSAGAASQAVPQHVPLAARSAATTDAADRTRMLAEMQSRMSASAAGVSGQASAGSEALPAGSPPLSASAPEATIAPAGTAPSPVVRQRTQALQGMEQQRAFKEIQRAALEEIMAIPPGDTKKMIAALERFDARLRDAGAPPLLDMAKLRKALESADQLQNISKSMVAEANKGKAADQEKIRRMTQDMARLQAEMPNQFYNLEELKKAMR